MTPPSYKGTLITLEGIDGSGKTLLLYSLTKILTAENHSLIITKEPGGTSIGKMLKRVLLEEEKACDPRVEFLLFAADRAEHFKQLIIPALTRGDIVISDRMADSALAYQGYGRGVDHHFITTANQFAMHGIEPDITFYLRISPEQALAWRNARKGDQSIMDNESIEFFNKVVQGYEHIAVLNPERVIAIDATQRPEDVARIALEHIHAHLKQKNS